MSYPDIVLSRQTLLTCLETILTMILLFFSQERTGYGRGKFQSSEDVAKARGAAPWTRAPPISRGKSAGLLRAGPTWWLYESSAVYRRRGSSCTSSAPSRPSSSTGQARWCGHCASAVSKEEEDDNIIMLLLSNDSPSSAAVADLLHSSLITMVESCISCTRYEIFVNKLQRYICSTLNPFMAAWLLPARCRCYQSHVMCLVLQSRMRPYSRILLSPWFCYDQLYFQEWQANVESREAGCHIFVFVLVQILCGIPNTRTSSVSTSCTRRVLFAFRFFCDS